MKNKLFISGIILTMLLLLNELAIPQSMNPAVTIATSNHHLATAYNNGRRLVRDSQDHRYVVYQDVGGDLPIICLVHSADGKAWSQPDTLADGAFPSLAIDQTDRLFLVWQAADTSGIYFTYRNDSGMSWQTPYREISQVSAERTQFPVIEAGYRRIHIAWQQDFYLQPWRCVQGIFYSFIALDSLESSFARPSNISCSEHDSKFPSIAHNLAFEEGNLHAVWYDSTSTDSSMMTMIMYRAVDETLGVWNPPLSSNPSFLSENCGVDGVHPAVSVGFGDFAHVVWGTLERDRFFSYFFEIEGLQYLNPYEIQDDADPFICVDDVYIHTSSIVWTNRDQIFYSQIFFPQNYLTFPVILSDVPQSKKFHPGVCYKHFNQDSLDVVWSEGNNAPYKIMYRRMKKNYSYQEVEHTEAENQLPQKLILKPNYPNPFNSFTTIRYDLPRSGFVTLEIYNFLGQKLRTLVAEDQKQGEYQINWDGHDEWGNLLPSGIYLSQLRADHQIFVRKIALIK
jgi:hypothetical protein